MESSHERELALAHVDAGGASVTMRSSRQSLLSRAVPASTTIGGMSSRSQSRSSVCDFAYPG
jgi:hypothetical protein